MFRRWDIAQQRFSLPPSRSRHRESAPRTTRPSSFDALRFGRGQTSLKQAFSCHSNHARKLRRRKPSLRSTRRHPAGTGAPRCYCTHAWATLCRLFPPRSLCNCGGRIVRLETDFAFILHLLLHPLCIAEVSLSCCQRSKRREKSVDFPYLFSSQS